MLMFSSIVIISDIEDNTEASIIVNNGLTYTSHAPIKIESNSDFDAAHGVTNSATGNGTQGNPWIIEGWSITGNDHYGIWIEDTTDYYTIRNCWLHNLTRYSLSYYSGSGVILWNAENGIIENSIFSDCQNGIALQYGSNNIQVFNNTIFNTNSGISLHNVQHATLQNNTLNEGGIIIDGDQLDKWNTHEIDTSNIVNGLPVFYDKNKTSGVVPQGYGEIILANCDNMVIENHNINLGQYSIILGFSNRNWIANNTITMDGSINYGWNTGWGIWLQYSNRNILYNNNITNATYAINLEYCEENRIEYNYASENTYAIYEKYGNNNNVNNNTFFNNRLYFYGDENTISDNHNFWSSIYSRGDRNTISNNILTSCGVGLSTVEDCILTGNVMTNSGIDISGDSVSNWDSHTIDDTNTVNGKPVTYLKNQNNLKVAPGAGQIILADCTEITIENYTLSNASAPIILGFSGLITIKNCNIINNYNGISAFMTDVDILDNNISLNRFGIYIRNPGYIDIINNNFTDNEWYGIYIRANDYDYHLPNRILGNNFIRNGQTCIYLDKVNNTYMRDNLFSQNGNAIKMFHCTWSQIISNTFNYSWKAGVTLYNCTTTWIYWNTFVHSPTFDDRWNNWDNGHHFGGNYWSDYDGVDYYQGPDQNETGSDGFGDTSYRIINNKSIPQIYGPSEDRYPLIKAPNDIESPVCELNEIDPYWINYSPFTITATAEDPGKSGVRNLTLEYRYNQSNRPYYDDDWNTFNSDSIAPYSWDFLFPKGEGYYEFQCSALDYNYNYGRPKNWESVCYDITNPELVLNSPANKSSITPGTFLNFSISDSHMDKVNYTINNQSTRNFYNPYNLNTSTWEDGLYFIKISALDYATNTVSEDYEFSIDGIPPVIVSTNPKDNSINVTVNTIIYISFNESMNLTSLDSIIIENLTNEIVTQLTWNENNQNLTITITPHLHQNTSYTITIPSETKDIAGNKMTENFSFEFSTCLDNDEDGLSDTLDEDDDNDGVPDTEDAFPMDPTEWVDTDGDGIGNNADPDDDNDGIPDEVDDEPLIPNTVGGIGDYWWAIVLLIIIGLFGAILFLSRARHEIIAEPEEPALETEVCPTCGFDIEPGTACPFCTMDEPKQPPRPEPKPEPAIKAKLTNEEKLTRLEKAYKEGKMTEEQYLANREKFGGQ